MTPPSLSSLSAGIIVRQLLTQSPEVQRITHRIFPIVIDEAVLPYVVYRRAALETQPTKSLQSADTATIEVACYAATYGESVDLAEAVRHALDHQQATSPEGLHLRACILDDAEELWDSEAFGQLLTFRAKV